MSDTSKARWWPTMTMRRSLRDRPGAGFCRTRFLVNSSAQPKLCTYFVKSKRITIRQEFPLTRVQRRAQVEKSVMRALPGEEVSPRRGSQGFLFLTYVCPGLLCRGNCQKYVILGRLMRFKLCWTGLLAVPRLTTNLAALT